MQELEKVFSFGENEVRTITKDGEAWFIAKDIANVLDFRNAHDMIRVLDEDEKRVLKRKDIENAYSAFTNTKGRSITLITEAGLYSCILRSSKPEAKPFKR